MSRVLPILFNTEMVREILDGRKTVTRRCVKFPINKYTDKIPSSDDVSLAEMHMKKVIFHEKPFYSFNVTPPYQSGDILYVRETFCSAYDGEKYFYFADKNTTREERRLLDYNDVKWRPSLHMPKEAARIWLKVTDVRVERLQDITDEQAEKEGCSDYTSTANGFCYLWDSTIKKSNRDRYGWEANPWVWVIEFERCEKPEGEEE